MVSGLSPSETAISPRLCKSKDLWVIQRRKAPHIYYKIPPSQQSPNSPCFGLLHGSDYSSVSEAPQCLWLMFLEVLLQAPFHGDMFILQLYKPFSMEPHIKELSLQGKFFFPPKLIVGRERVAH